MDETTNKGGGGGGGSLGTTEMETAGVQERGHESSQDSKAGEPRIASDSAGSETPGQPDGGLWAWIVYSCLTAMLNYGHPIARETSYCLLPDTF